MLIPTRDRPATFRHTLATVAAQEGDDYEIVVADNASSPETRRIVEELGSPALRYLRSDEVLPMADNWERGLAECRGEYVTVLGDDDGFLPSTLRLARMIIAVSQPQIIGWQTHVYWWPDTIVPWLRNMLLVSFDDKILQRSSRDALQSFYRGELSFGALPMIYTAFFHRTIIEEARSRYGGFFVPRDTSPDIASGILGLHLTDRHVYSMRPLTMRGNSGKSIGTAHWARSFGAERRENYVREERASLERIVHPALIPSPSLHVHVASSLLKCREVYFPADEGLAVDLQNVVHSMIENLNLWPESYDDALADARALAAKLGMRIDPAAIPAKAEVVRKVNWGPSLHKDGSVPFVQVNGALAGLATIADASRLAEAMLPPLPAAPAGAAPH